LATPTVGGCAGFAGTIVSYCWMGHGASETEEPAEAGSSRICSCRALAVGDVADELLGLPVRPLVLPMVELEGLVRRAVFEVELAAGVPERARELGGPAEERRDEDRRIPDAGGVADRARIERAARDRASQVAAELTLDGCIDEMSVLADRVTGARALAGRGQEGAVVLAADAERSVLVRLD